MCGFTVDCKFLQMLFYCNLTDICFKSQLCLVSDNQKFEIYASMFASPPSPAAVFGLGLGEGAGLGTAGVLRPVGIGGRMGLTLDPGRLSEEGDVAAAS